MIRSILLFGSKVLGLKTTFRSKIPNFFLIFDAPISKDWEDTNAFRFGITQELDEYTLMAGLVIDETPVPDEKVSFELPDSDSVSVSLGGRYQYNEEWNFGVGMPYSMREERTVDNEEIKGEFSNSNVLVVSAGVGYTF